MKKKTRIRWVVGGCAALGLSMLLAGACKSAGGSTAPITVAKTPQGEVSFSGTIQPILKDHCQRCHGAKRKGDLYLLDHAGVMKGGKDGPVVLAGQPDQSRIVTSVEMTREPYMPPRVFPSLTKDRIDALRAWIAEGAKNN